MNRREPPQPLTVTEVRVLETVDAMTFICEPVVTRFKVRLANVEPWASSKIRQAMSDDDIEKGKTPKAAGERLLCEGPIYLETKPTRDFQAVSRDSSGHVLGTLKVYRLDTGELVDVGDWLKQNGHARH